MRKKKYYELITDSAEIEALGSRYSMNPRPRCGKCKRPTLKLMVDRGPTADVHVVPRRIEVGRWCLKCEIFYRKKKMVIEGYG